MKMASALRSIRMSASSASGAPGLFISQLHQGLAREAQIFAPAGAVLEHDDGGSLSTANLKGERASAPDRFVVLVRCDNDHRFAEGRPDRDGADKVGEVVRHRGQSEHAQLDIAQPGLQE